MAASNERQYFIYTCLRKFLGRRVLKKKLIHTKVSKFESKRELK